MSTEQLSTQERFKRGAADAGRYFQFMSEFIGFTPQDAATIRETRFIIEKYIPTIVADFYSQVLRYPATRRPFQKKDGSIDQKYLEMRMQHQAGFWRRTASGDFDEDYARFVDYVGRAHTSQGADPKIYIPERYVMGMVGFVQDRIGQALTAELRDYDPDLEVRGIKAWNRLLMVLLEMLARPYGHGREAETFEPGEPIDDQAVRDLAVETYERALGMARSVVCTEVLVGPAGDIPDGERRIIQVGDLSVGVFHHNGAWYAMHNSCLHRGGPVATGKLEGDTITCPWHGYQYDVTSGQLLLDRHACLPTYRVEVRDGQVYVYIPELIRDPVDISMANLVQKALREETPASQANGPAPAAAADVVGAAPRGRPGQAHAPAPAANEILLANLAPGQVALVRVDGEDVAVYNVDGAYYATQDACTHAGGPLSDGELNGREIICPWHASCFDVANGGVTCGPATEPLKTYRVEVEGEVVRVLAE
jgi:nitrite reductase/ring-hydroxylating ferredoxin subunit